MSHQNKFIDSFHDHHFSQDKIGTQTAFILPEKGLAWTKKTAGRWAPGG
jgi:hypothetical protein